MCFGRSVLIAGLNSYLKNQISAVKTADSLLQAAPVYFNFISFSPYHPICNTLWIQNWKTLDTLEDTQAGSDIKKLMKTELLSGTLAPNCLPILP